jgi:hypothetical protein
LVATVDLFKALGGGWESEYDAAIARNNAEQQ